MLNCVRPDHQDGERAATTGEAAPPAGTRPGGDAQRAAGQAQRLVPKPSDMLIPRTGLFYCATFPCRPGLPSTRAGSSRSHPAKPALIRPFQCHGAFPFLGSVPACTQHCIRCSQSCTRWLLCRIALDAVATEYQV